MIRSIPMAMLAFVALASSGCSMLYHFEASGRIVDAETGEPIACVGVEICYRSGYVIGKMTSTDENGAYTISFSTTDSKESLHREWKLVAVRDGYEKEEVKIEPQREPQTVRDVVRFTVDAKMLKSP